MVGSPVHHLWWKSNRRHTNHNPCASFGTQSPYKLLCGNLLSISEYLESHRTNVVPLHSAPKLRYAQLKLAPVAPPTKKRKEERMALTCHYEQFPFWRCLSDWDHAVSVPVRPHTQTHTQPTKQQKAWTRINATISTRARFFVDDLGTLSMILFISLLDLKTIFPTKACHYLKTKNIGECIRYQIQWGFWCTCLTQRCTAQSTQAHQ